MVEALAAQVQELLDTAKFRVNQTPHIRVHTETCHECDLKPCLTVCPARLFVVAEGELLFSYEGCFECGTCYVACGRDAIEWEYPQGGFGVVFRDS